LRAGCINGVDFVYVADETVFRWLALQAGCSGVTNDNYETDGIAKDKDRRALFGPLGADRVSVA
jgi:hypothetical protein